MKVYKISGSWDSALKLNIEMAKNISYQITCSFSTIANFRSIFMA